MGLIGWFVTWQVMENIDNLSDQVQDGIDELRRWLLDSPFHVTDKQINEIAKNLLGGDRRQHRPDHLGRSGGRDGRRRGAHRHPAGGLLHAVPALRRPAHLEWTLKLVPAAARPGVAGAGPRAWRTLTAYVRGTVIVALIDAIFIGLGIYFLDVPMAVPLAVFIFLFAFVPLVGAVVSGALAVVVALVTQGVFTAVMTLGGGPGGAGSRPHPPAVHPRPCGAGASAGRGARGGGRPGRAASAVRWSPYRWSR
ncbi:hypothetical protein SFUMM280S_02184 [Streptomyces fumanus]